MPAGNNYRIESSHNFFKGKQFTLIAFGHVVATGLPSRYAAQKLARGIDTKEKAIALSNGWGSQVLHRMAVACASPELTRPNT